MIIYNDLVTGGELFSDCFKMVSKEDGYIIGCCGKMETRSSSGISSDLLGGNASAEADQQEEQCDDSGTETNIDVILNHSIKECDLFVTKKLFMSYMKKHVKQAIEKMDKEKQDKFKKESKTKFEKFLELFTDDATVYIPGNADLDMEMIKGGEGQLCTVLIGVWNEDGMSITFYALKDCLVEEKV